MEPSTVKKAHAKACKGDKKKPGEWLVQPFPLYTLRHTCLTRWAPHMDPWTLAYLAGHSNMNTTKRYIHPQSHTIRDAMEKARMVPGGHSSGHNAENAGVAPPDQLAAIN